MNRGNEDIKAGLIRMVNDPTATRNTVRILMEAVGALERLEEELDAAEVALQEAIAALSSKKSQAGEGAVTATKEGLKEGNQADHPSDHGPKKRGRPAK